MNKEDRYKSIIKQLNGLLPDCNSPISRMSTISALLHHKMEHFFWAGFYLLENDNLCIGPYQGALACLSLEKNKGVCWTAINQRKAIVVADVHKFPGHIACDARSNSEIAVPIFDNSNIVVAVLDVDSREFSNFDEIDVDYLEQIAKLIYYNILSEAGLKDFFNEIENSVTICDAQGIIVYMNNKSIETFQNSGGANLLGSNLFDCHPGDSKNKLKEIIEKHN